VWRLSLIIEPVTVNRASSVPGFNEAAPAAPARSSRIPTHDAADGAPQEGVIAGAANGVGGFLSHAFSGVSRSFGHWRANTNDSAQILGYGTAAVAAVAALGLLPRLVGGDSWKAGIARIAVTVVGTVLAAGFFGGLASGRSLVDSAADPFVDSFNLASRGVSAIANMLPDETASEAVERTLNDAGISTADADMQEHIGRMREFDADDSAEAVGYVRDMAAHLFGRGIVNLETRQQTWVNDNFDAFKDFGSLEGIETPEQFLEALKDPERLAEIDGSLQNGRMGNAPLRTSLEQWRNLDGGHTMLSQARAALSGEAPAPAPAPAVDPAQPQDPEQVVNPGATPNPHM
jgi:hypothetical protein